MTSAEAIVDAARQAIAQRGPGKLRLSAVAEVAGVSRQTLYRWFPTKEDLLAAVAEQERERFDAGLVEVISETRTPALQLDVALRYLITYLDTAVGSGTIGADPAFAIRSLAESLPPSIDSLVRHLGDALDEIPVVASGDVDPAEAAELMLRLTYSHYLVPHPEPEALLSALRRFALLSTRSVGPTAGHG